MTHHFGQQAVVIGGSLAGLMTARVLAERFDAVTVLERDRIENRPHCIHRFRRATISMGCCWADSRS